MKLNSPSGLGRFVRRPDLNYPPTAEAVKKGTATLAADVRLNLTPLGVKRRGRLLQFYKHLLLKLRFLFFTASTVGGIHKFRSLRK